MATLQQMLSVREARQARIFAALDRAPLISFTMNIPGPDKNSPLIRRGFAEGCRRLANAFSGKGLSLTLLSRQDEETGCEALYAAEGDALAVKRLCCAIEDGDETGRLFDMDVIDRSGRKLDRTLLGLKERSCMVCGAEGRGCASRRLHSLTELQAETDRRLRLSDCRALATLVTKSLLDEVGTTPKPGLVDRANSGSHRDMDLPLFEKSAAALTPYWAECTSIGMETTHLLPEETFLALRRAGLAAEQTMLSATGGINTHKGAIFLLGILCGAAGRLWSADGFCRSGEALCSECARMTRDPLQAELDHLDEAHADTSGAKLFLQNGLRGARGEAMDGLPGVRETALPALKNALRQGCGREHAAAVALLHLVARGTDTNMVKRGGAEGAAWGAAQAAKLLDGNALPSAEQIAALDSAFIRRNLSPGGCADLLAATLFLYDLECSE